MRRSEICFIVLGLMIVLVAASPASAVESECETCHAELTPMLVKDFNRGVMSETMGCADCHGEGHTAMDDADMAELPTIATCQACHEEKAEQYLAGKHAKGLLAVQALPFSHGQPDAFVAGQRGCGGCHTLGLVTQEDRKTEARQYYTRSPRRASPRPVRPATRVSTTRSGKCGRPRSTASPTSSIARHTAARPARTATWSTVTTASAPRGASSASGCLSRMRSGWAIERRSSWVSACSTPRVSRRRFSTSSRPGIWPVSMRTRSTPNANASHRHLRQVPLEELLGGQHRQR